MTGGTKSQIAILRQRCLVAVLRQQSWWQEGWQASPINLLVGRVIGMAGLALFTIGVTKSRRDLLILVLFVGVAAMGPGDTETRRRRQLEWPDAGFLFWCSFWLIVGDTKSRFLFCVLFGWLLEPQRADSGHLVVVNWGGRHTCLSFNF
jgi:hypothetical protein